MKNKPTVLYLDQYRNTYFATSVRALRKMIKNGSSTVSKMYVDKTDGTVSHVGYVIGGHWLTPYVPVEKPAN